MLDYVGYSEDMLVFRDAREENGKLKYILIYHFTR